MEPRVCELCGSEASVFCISDSAFLCWNCDASVHGANFLVARHVRRILCYRCKRLGRNHFSGAGAPGGGLLCRSCASDGPDVSDRGSLSDSSSSTCISSSGSFCGDQSRPTRSLAMEWMRDSSAGQRPAAGALEFWCRSLGLPISCSVLSLALRALETCCQRYTALPLPVCLAASLWCAAKVCHARGTSLLRLRRLERCSGVPAKLILLAESKLRRILNVKKLKQQVEAEEGCAES